MLLSNIKDHFGRRAQKYESSAQWVKDEGLLKVIKELAGTSDKDYVLDVATGTGIISQLFFKKTKLVVGLDATEAMYRQSLSKLNFMVCGQAECLPFRDNSFDLVVCRQGLQFMDASSVARQMHRVCKDRGRIILVQLVAFGIKDKEYAFKIQMARQPVRANCFLEEDLVNLLKGAGCKKIRDYHYFSYESVNEWINNGALPLKRQEEIKRLYHEAPSQFRKIHELKFAGTDIIDKMKIAIVCGHKN